MLGSLIKPKIKPDHQPAFFWSHLEKDLELLAKAIGKGLDEAAVLIHLMLKTLMLDPPRCWLFSNIDPNGHKCVSLLMFQLVMTTIWSPGVQGIIGKSSLIKLVSNLCLR